MTDDNVIWLGEEMGEPDFLPVRNCSDRVTLNVLVVEDDPDVSSLIQMAIHAWELPLNVDFVNNGYRALRRVMKQVPDLMLLDLRLPVLDGFSIMRALHDAGHTFPLVVITGLHRDDVDAIGDLPENAYLMQKPIDLHRFRKLLEKLIDQELLEKGEC